MILSTAFSPSPASKPSPQTSKGIGQVLHSAWLVLQPFQSAVVLGTALIAIACASIFVVIAEQDLNPEAIAFDRLLIAAIAFGGWTGLQNIATQQPISPLKAASETSPSEALGWQNLALFFVAGISFAASFICAAWSLSQTNVATAALLNNMMPIFSTLGAWLLLGKQFSLRFVLGLGVAITGVVVMGIQDFHVSSSQLVGDAAALGAAVLLAIAILSVEQLRSKFPTSIIMMSIGWVGSLAIAPILFLSGNSVFPSTWTSGLAVLALALVSQVLGHGLLAHSLKQFSSEVVSISMLVIPVISALLAAVLFAQQISFVSSCAFIIVLTGIYLSISATDQP